MAIEVSLVDQPMGFQTSLLVFLAFLPAIFGQKSEEARLVIDTSTTVAETDANYICATIDWWPQDKCNYNRCPWGSSSAINLVRILLLWMPFHVKIGSDLFPRFICGYQIEFFFFVRIYLTLTLPKLFKVCISHFITWVSIYFAFPLHF